MRVRAAYNATGTDKNPYLLKGKKPSKTAVRIGIFYLAGADRHSDRPVLRARSADCWPLSRRRCGRRFRLIYWKLPADKFHRSRVHPVIPLRYMTMLRLGYITVLFTTLAELTLLTGRPGCRLLFSCSGCCRLFTSFSFFMILRQLVQHGNGDRGWLTNTRTFFVGPIIRFAVFPMGQDYHLPHHIFATIPHYRLNKLHDHLLQYDEYREHAVTVEGYFFPPRTPQTNPTVLDILGPDHAAKHTEDVHIDNTVMDGDEFEGKEEIERMGQALQQTGS